MDLLGQGNTAEIYQFDNNKILKLFRESFPVDAVENEYRIAKILQNELDNIPKVYDIVKYKQRTGIVYEQIIGNDMIKVCTRTVKINHYTRLFASAHASIHSKNINIEYSVKDKLNHDIDSASELTPQEKIKLKKYILTLPDKNQICHFDFHPGNVMIRDGEAVVIDWMTACTGDANADVARTLLLMNSGEIMNMNRVISTILHICMKSMGRKYFKEYQKLTNTNVEDVNKWKLPVAAARLSEWLTDHERAKLLSYVRKEVAMLSI